MKNLHRSDFAVRQALLSLNVQSGNGVQRSAGFRKLEIITVRETGKIIFLARCGKMITAIAPGKTSGTTAQILFLCRGFPALSAVSLCALCGSMLFV
jgi:hypothetical protein